MEVWMIVAMLGDTEVAMEVAATLDAAIYRACHLQAELIAENLGLEVDDYEDEDDITKLNQALESAFRRKLDDRRYAYASVKDDMDVEWRLKKTKVRTRKS